MTIVDNVQAIFYLLYLNTYELASVSFTVRNNLHYIITISIVDTSFFLLFSLLKLALSKIENLLYCYWLGLSKKVSLFPYATEQESEFT